MLLINNKWSEERKTSECFHIATVYEFKFDITKLAIKKRDNSYIQTIKRSLDRL